MQHVFLSGNVALDLAGTLKWRGSATEELLATPEDLDDWLVQAGLLDAPPASAAADLAAAHALREAVYALALARLGAGPVPAPAREAVNRAAAHPPVTVSLGEQGLRRTGDVPAALAEVARAALDLFGAERDALVKQCAREACTRVYLDRSRGGRRSWCGMAECGDRVKAASYRQRQRAAGR